MTGRGWVTKVGMLLALLLPLALGGCGSKSSAGSDSSDDFLVRHNARFNDGRTFRWASNPIPVFTNGLAQRDEVTAWTGATRGAVTFTFVGSRPSAGIAFRASDLPLDTCAVTTVLHTNTIREADVEINTAIYRSRLCVRTVVHETGHAIGFFGHTGDGGLMDPDGGNGDITPPVADMIRRLYGLPPGTAVGDSERARMALSPRDVLQSTTFVTRARR
jgi:hypothetical protein